jgi:plasmid stabilization system protein ParE
MTVDFHPEASNEVVSARRWYDEQSATAARRFQNEIDQAVEAIDSFPLRWPVGILKTRFLTLEHFPYSVIYRPRESGVLVLAVAHASRRPGYWKGRLS